jgi:beta-lactamase regulating signal transducer with metallopeptidase domain
MEKMSYSVFTEIEFWLMVVVSLLAPFAICATLLAKSAVSRNIALTLGFTLVVIAGLDVYFLQSLAAAAKLTPSPADDAVFVSEITLALYLLPAMFGGIGVNIISHVLVHHLDEAQARFAQEHTDADLG